MGSIPSTGGCELNQEYYDDVKLFIRLTSYWPRCALSQLVEETGGDFRKPTNIFLNGYANALLVPLHHLSRNRKENSFPSRRLHQIPATEPGEENGKGCKLRKTIEHFSFTPEVFVTAGLWRSILLEIRGRPHLHHPEAAAITHENWPLPIIQISNYPPTPT